MEPLREFLDLAFQWPIVPATVLVLFIVLYWLLVILGALDIDVLDLDFDFDADADSVLGLGWVGLRFLNLGEVPLMLWGSLFGLSWWTFALVFESPQTEWMPIVWAIARDIGVALVATKLLTQPLRGKFEHKEPNTPAEMIGRTCVITTSEVTPTFGHAECTTEGAPLILTVRVREATLQKGDIAVIEEYDAEHSFYYVSRSEEEREN